MNSSRSEGYLQIVRVHALAIRKSKEFVNAFEFEFEFQFNEYLSFINAGMDIDSKNSIPE